MAMKSARLQAMAISSKLPTRVASRCRTHNETHFRDDGCLAAIAQFGQAMRLADADAILAVRNVTVVLGNGERDRLRLAQSRSIAGHEP
jgi:hypothetical protein